MTQFLDTPVDKSLGATGTWTDIDLSSNIPVGATGAIFQVRNTHGAADIRFGLRKKGSGDSRYNYIRCASHMFCAIGVDANRKCQGAIETLDIDFHLVGYTEVDATFFTNAYNKSQSTLGAWTDLDLSTELPAGSVAAVFQVINTYASTYRSWGLRKKGSTDNRYNTLNRLQTMYFIVGVDANRKCQFKIQTADIDFYLLGYLSGGESETNGVDRSLGSTGSYIDITESNAPAGATGAFVELASTSYSYNFAARKKGASGDIYDDPSDTVAGIFVGLDANKKWEGKIAHTDVDFYTLGYFSAGIVEKTSSDTGAGADALAELLATRLETDTGAGVDSALGVVAAILRAEAGAGADYFAQLESFETGFGDWVSSGDLGWTRRDSPTPTANSGPDSAYDGDWFIYTEASTDGVGYPYKVSYLTYNGALNSFDQINFWYHKYGIDCGPLELHAYYSGAWHSVWSRPAGDEGDTWFNVTAYFPVGTTNIRFKSTTGDYAYGDTALDLINIDGNPLATTTKTETGAGVDAVLGVAAAILGVETGVGADVISQSLLARLETDTGVGVDALISLLKVVAKFGSDTGMGVDAVFELLAALAQSDQGTGVEAIKARLLCSSDVGVGADAWLSLLAAIEQSDSGVGADAWLSLLAAIEQSDLGAGVETTLVTVFLYLLLKLLQEKGLNIELSQGGRVGDNGSWLVEYAFRKKCNIIATAAGAQTNYQLELIVGESSGASGVDVHCNAHCEDFPNDIRFTKEDGVTKHDYWIEKIEGNTPNRKATVIIEVASIPASGSVDFYMYYSKAEESSGSNGVDTFIFFTENPESLNFTETQALNVSGKGWQGVASDGTNLYLFAKDSNNNIIYKFNKSGTQLDVNSSPGFDHMSDGCYHNSKLYVADMDDWYDGQPHSEAKGAVRLYNVTSGLPYANEEHAVGDHWAESVAYYDGYWWITFHCCSIIRKYNSSWGFIKEYDIDGHGGTDGTWADGNGYQGIDFFQYSGKTYAGLTVHHSGTGGPEFYYFEYDSEADDFTLIDHFDPPNAAANQGWCCDDPLNISDVWFADRAYAQPPNARIRQHAGSFSEKTTGNWEEWTDRTGASLEIVDTPQKRSSSKAFKLTQDSSSIHGWWRDKFGQSQTGKFWIEFDARFPANNKKHVISGSEETLSWVEAKQGPYIVMNRDGTHEGWISVYESAYNDIQTFSTNQWYKFGELVDITADTWDLWIDGIEKDTALTFYTGNTLSNIRQINVGGYLAYPAGYYYVQDVRIRKHASPEPTWGAWYEEETPYIMLKLLQDKELNIELSQEGKPS